MQTKFSNCIYILTHECAYNVNGIPTYKIGSSKVLPGRILTYKTYYPIDKNVLGYFYIYNYDCYQLDDDIKIDFNDLRIKLSGGIEFYKNIHLNLIENYLSKRNIKYDLYQDQDYLNINLKYFDTLLNDGMKEQYNIYKKNYIPIDNAKTNLINILKKFYSYGKTKEERYRNKIQEIYINSTIYQLERNKKCFIKAPTGFGKTHIYYKIIMKMNFRKILFMTPRKLLNEQLLEQKYSHYINNTITNIIHFSELNSEDKNTCFKKLKDNFIITSCYQSKNKLLDLIKKYNIKFDIIIFDEAHTIDTWSESENEFIVSESISNYKLFGSATPTDYILRNSIYYGRIIEKVKVYELINKDILCNIQTIIKKLDNQKKEYHDLSNLIIQSMIKFDKKKGIIYVNTCANAENLYRLLKLNKMIYTYIYVSKTIDDLDDYNDISIKEFENNIKPSVIISVGKIGYGYDNDFIDLICLGDSRQSDIDIRQIIGRGTRYNKKTYPNKLLHLLIPLYKDQFNTYSENKHLKKYLDYIIGECGQDIIIKSDNQAFISNKTQITNGINYNGDEIPIEILNEYCTTGYNKFSDFMRFLRINRIYDEKTYNTIKDNQDWMIDLGLIHEKYPKFCFRDIHPNAHEYYWTKEEAKQALKKSKTIIIDKIGMDKFKKLDNKDKINKLIELDNKIPNINLDLYYPK